MVVGSLGYDRLKLTFGGHFTLKGMVSLQGMVVMRLLSCLTCPVVRPPCIAPSPACLDLFWISSWLRDLVAYLFLAILLPGNRLLLLPLLQPPPPSLGMLGLLLIRNS